MPSSSNSVFPARPCPRGHSYGIGTPYRNPNPKTATVGTTDVPRTQQPGRGGRDRAASARLPSPRPRCMALLLCRSLQQQPKHVATQLCELQCSRFLKPNQQGLCCCNPSPTSPLDSPHTSHIGHQASVYSVLAGSLHAALLLIKSVKCCPSRVSSVKCAQSWRTGTASALHANSHGTHRTKPQ